MWTNVRFRVRGGHRRRNEYVALMADKHNKEGIYLLRVTKQEINSTPATERIIAQKLQRYSYGS